MTRTRVLWMGVLCSLLAGQVTRGGAAPSGSAKSIVVPDVVLVDQNGRERALRPLIAAHRSVVVNFFFTGCGTICPAQTAVLRDMQRHLDPGDDVLVLSVSVTPEADQPPALRSYASRFKLPPSENWLLLTGDTADIRRVLEAFGLNLRAATQHPNLLWLGWPRQDVWRASTALVAPAELATLLQRSGT